MPHEIDAGTVFSMMSTKADRDKLAMVCMLKERFEGRAAPRSCPQCGLGPCKELYELVAMANSADHEIVPPLYYPKPPNSYSKPPSETLAETVNKAGNETDKPFDLLCPD